MVEVIESAVNTRRSVLRSYKQKTFEFDNHFPEAAVFSEPSDFGECDVVFVLGRDVLHGHQSLFASISKTLKNFFDIMNSEDCDPYVMDSSGLLRFSKAAKGSRKVFIDSSLQVFEPIFNYCYSGRLSVPLDLVPSVYLLAKRLEICVLQVALANHLSQNVTVGTIGELCRMTPLSQLIDSGCLETTENKDVIQAERTLALSICQFLVNKADSVACSLTGQLSARLIVNLTTDFLNGSATSERNRDLNMLSPQSDLIAFAVLKWAHRRLLAGERLARVGSEENVQPDDEESDGGAGSGGLGTGSSHGSVSFGMRTRSLIPAFGLISQLNTLNTADQQRMHRHNSGQLLSSDEEDEVQMDSDSRDSPLHIPTQDVRITVDLSELDCQSTVNGVSNTDTANQTSDPVLAHETDFHLLTYCHPDGVPESESCLLARTSLGVGSTSIWLGKLMGHLVSLSIKRCRPTVHTNGALNGRHSLHSAPACSDSEDTSTSEDELFRKRSNSAVLLTPRSAQQTSELLADEEVALTMTAASASHLAKAAAVVRHTNGSIAADEYQNGLRLCTATPTSDAYLDDGKTASSQLLESRAGAGAGVLSVEGVDYLLLVGGYTRKGCLDKVELFRRPASSPLGPPIVGPRLSKLRGRVGLASTHCGTLYACGGSTGSVDLASVERLTARALHSWLSAHVSLEDLDDPFAVRSPHHSGSSSGGASGSNGSFSVWQSVARLNQPRGSPTAVGLNGLQTGALVSDSRESLLVAGGLADAEALFTTEAYIPERDQWVSMPNMCEARSEASACVCPSRNLIVVAGGNANASRMDRSEALVEALDPRCSEWMYLPSPSPVAGSQLRGAALVPSPSSTDNLLLIGGFNGRETLNSVWTFDVAAWNWIPAPPLQCARASHCAVTWPDQSATIVLGGFNPSACKTGFLNSVELISSPST